MIAFDEAQALLAGAVAALGDEEMPIDAAAGRVLAEPVHAAVSSPRRDVSAMDGYALRDGDARVGARFTLIGESLAGGAVPPPVGPGETVRIFTGAALPPGADRVVMQENCEADDAAMIIARPYGPGWHVRRAGSDFAEGDLLLARGTPLDPQAMVTLAAADRARVRVHRRPRMALIATGDELTPPGTARGRPLAIPESVSFGVAALAAQHGADLVSRHSGRDSLPELEAIAAQALEAGDLVVVTGGASVGARDFAKAMFAPHGLDLLFAKVAIKPGKPVWLGRAGTRWVLGLPGNPTSAMVTARLFLAPLLAALHGRPPQAVLGWLPLPLASALPATEERMTFVRTLWTGSGLAPLGNQDSGVQGALGRARWLVRCDAGSPALEPGAIVRALAF